MLCLQSSTMLSTHLHPSPILARIYFTTTVCILDCNTHSVKFLNIKSRYSLSHISHERYHFWSRRSYLTSENDNKIYLSPTPRPFVLGVRYEPHPRGIYSKFLWLDSWSSLWAHPIDITFGFFQT